MVGRDAGRKPDLAGREETSETGATLRNFVFFLTPSPFFLVCIRYQAPWVVKDAKQCSPNQGREVAFLFMSDLGFCFFLKKRVIVFFGFAISTWTASTLVFPARAVAQTAPLETPTAISSLAGSTRASALATTASTRQRCSARTCGVRFAAAPHASQAPSAFASDQSVQVGAGSAHLRRSKRDGEADAEAEAEAS